MCETVYCSICKNPCSNDGYCSFCIEKLMNSGQCPPKDLPERAWVFCQCGAETFTFITIHSRLVLFTSKAEAESILPLLKEGGIDTTTIGVEEVATNACWAYAVLNNLALARVSQLKIKSTQNWRDN